tara:strand:- start:296 stop:601 length:306 start_codon:yes stop_codon:yes gene_type:complete
MGIECSGRRSVINMVTDNINQINIRSGDELDIEPLHEININDLNCIICLENIDEKTLAWCFVCNTKLHRNCYNKWLSYKELTYCKCIQCQSIGTMTTLIKC